MRSVLLLSFMLLGTAASAQPTPLSSDDILKEASATAKAGNKKVFIIFHASWCGWCVKMDNAMNDPSVKKFFDDEFVIRHLVVQESADKKKLENPGAMELLNKYHGGNSGIPYWLIFDSEGRLLADSKMRVQGAGLQEGENAGCPASEKEVAFFADILAKTTSLKESELALIRARFRQNAP